MNILIIIDDVLAVSKYVICNKYYNNKDIVNLSLIKYNIIKSYKNNNIIYNVSYIYKSY